VTGEPSPSAFTILTSANVFGFRSVVGSDDPPPSPAPDRDEGIVTWWRPDYGRVHHRVQPEPWMVRLKEAYDAGYYKTEVDRELQESFPWQNHTPRDLCC
jgi:hypothetical protein